MICSENCVLYAKAAIQWFCSTSHCASFPISSSGTSFFHVFAGSVSPLQTLYCNRCQNASVLKRHWRLYTVVAHCQDVPDAKGNLLNGNGSMPGNHRNDPLAPRFLTHSTALIKAQDGRTGNSSVQLSFTQKMPTYRNISQLTSLRGP